MDKDYPVVPRDASKQVPSRSSGFEYVVQDFKHDFKHDLRSEILRYLDMQLSEHKAHVDWSRIQQERGLTRGACFTTVVLLVALVGWFL